MTKNCPLCLYPLTHPFDMQLSNQGCAGCVTHLEKDSLDWDVMREALAAHAQRVLKNTSGYHCVVPVIGDAEDYYTVSQVLDLGLNPLVVCVNDYFKNDIGWHNLHNLITHFDVDSIVYNPDFHVYKELVRTSLRKHSHVMLPFLQLHTSFPVHIAHERKIPLVVWGQNQAIEQVGKFSHLDDVKMSRWSRRQHDLFGVEIADLCGSGAQVNERYLNYYKYPDIKKLRRANIFGIYLSNYLRWDPLRQNSQMVRFGFKPERQQATFDPYERAGSSIYYGIHDLLKIKRQGFGKASDHIAREIRHARLTPQQGVELTKQFATHKYYIKDFFDWLGITKSGYEWILKHRLREISSRISDEQIHQGEVKLPQGITRMTRGAFAAAETYLTFEKGI